MNDRIVMLFEIYADSLKKEGKEIEVTKEEIWGILYPEDQYDDGRFRKLNSDLLKQFENFIAQRVYDEDKFLPHNLKVRAVKERKLSILYKSIIATAERSIEQTFNKSADYLYAKFYIEKEKMDFLTENDIVRKRSKKIEEEVNISEITDYLDQFYIASKLKYYLKLLGWKKLYHIEKDINHKESLMAMIDEVDYSHIAPISVYSTIVASQLEPEEEAYYYKLKDQVTKFGDAFPMEEIEVIYDALLTYCVQRVNKGDMSFQEETFNMYKEALRREVLFQDGYLSVVAFNNIAFFGLRTGNYDWTETFIHEYTPLLNEKDRVSSSAFSMARLEFYRNNFEKVILLLQKVEMESVIYNLSAKTILLSSYYELEEFDALDSFINSFRVYVNREKSLSARKKEHYKNLLKYINKIINIKPRDKNSIDRLIKEIEETPGVVIKPWLIQKLIEKKG